MKQKDILLLSIPSIFFILFWIGFGIFHYYRNSTSPDVSNIQVTDISSNFDTNTISNLKDRTQITPLYEWSTQAGITPSPSPTPIVPNNQATSSGQASPAGTLSL